MTEYTVLPFQQSGMFFNPFTYSYVGLIDDNNNETWFKVSMNKGKVAYEQIEGRPSKFNDKTLGRCTSILGRDTTEFEGNTPWSAMANGTKNYDELADFGTFHQSNSDDFKKQTAKPQESLGDTAQGTGSDYTGRGRTPSDVSVGSNR